MLCLALSRWELMLFRIRSFQGAAFNLEVRCSSAVRQRACAADATARTALSNPGLLIIWNTNGIMMLAWMLWQPYALGTRTELCLWHGCSGNRTLLEHARNYDFDVAALLTVCSWNTRGILILAWMLWYCYTHLEHERNYAFGVDALVTVCAWNTNGIMILAWMLWQPYALGTRTEV